ncbi:hypothetical protein [Mammaliicoccus sciuri]|uniref:hypothetical protein n=1 Tax=Mammaliicoccus sciuri TaxID=1296 RepID=UPI0019517928|nr:hypothetical protein [Mammaliicoccus sciuri]
MVNFGEEEVNETFETFDNDTKTLKENLKDYSVQRMSDSIISENHTRQTYLINDETIEKLEHLVSYVQASNGINSENNKGLNKTEINRSRALTKGFKSKAVNYAIQQFLDQWEEQEGLVPAVEHKKSKVGNVYHNYYMFTENGETYGIEQDNRGKELRYLSTANDDSVESIEQWFNEIEDQTVKTGAPRKNN